MERFFQHGRGTGGGSPILPPPEQDDINALPLEMPPHMQVRSYFSLIRTGVYIFQHYILGCEI